MPDSYPKCPVAAPPSAPTLPDSFRKVEDKLATHFSTRVKLKHSNNGRPGRTWYCYDGDDPAYLDGPAYLGISKRQMQRLVTDGKIGYTRLGLRTLFSQEQLDAYIASCTVAPRR